MASLTVSVENPDPQKPADIFDLKVEVTVADGLPKELFVYQRGAGPPRGVGTPATDIFVRVSTLSDVENLVAAAAAGTVTASHYRMAEVHLRFTTLAELLEVRELLLADVAGLVTATTQAEEDPVIEEIEITG